MTAIEIISIIGSLCFLLIVAALIKKGKLREEYSIVWLLINILLIYFSFFRNQLDVIAQFFGVFYAPALLFIIAIAGIFIFLLHLSVVVSKQQSKIKKLTQHIAQIEFELRKLQDDQKNS